MPRLARPADHARDRAAALATVASQWLVGPVRRRKKTLVLAGTALALAGAGSATAATVPQAPVPGAAQHVRLTADVRPAAHQAPRLPAIGSLTSQPAQRRAVPVPDADQLMPIGTSGAQNWMPISGSQLANAATIVQQALARQMGLRSAVIAVAAAMQESRLQDLGYGDADSLGLFQQRPSCGWGTAQQIMNPAFAADGFLAALQRFQASDPGWAAQPLWVSAQGVQKSRLPLAYAQWEAQAASLVKQVAVGQRQQ
jgi:hypothetical protein